MDAIFKIIAEAQAAAKEAAELHAKELEALRGFYGKNPQSKQQKDAAELEKVREVLQQLTGTKAENFIVLVGDEVDEDHVEQMQISCGNAMILGVMFNEFMDKFSKAHPNVILALMQANRQGL